MDELLNLGSAALKKAALSEEAKEFVLNNKPLYKLIRKAADRYIGGETLDETIPKVIHENKNGFKCSVEFMGESTRTEQESNEATQEFIRIAQEIKNQKLNSAFSLDLSHIGLVLSKELCLHNLNLICAEAKDIEVTISAEGHERTTSVMDVYQQVSKVHANLSITMQAYLHRSKDDFKELLKEQGRIRIVKGAFATPPEISIPRGPELDNVYLNYVDELLSRQHKCAIATHHHEVQQEAKKMIQKYKTAAAAYEFESLYGIQTEQLRALKDEGYTTKLYFVYGKEWYLYLCNRIAEYPLNLFRALDDIVR